VFRLNDSRRHYLRLLWPLALMVTILWSSGTGGPQVPRAFTFPHFDKVGHFFMFGLIATLLLRAVFHWPDRFKAVLFAVALTSLFGALDEFRQSLNPYRHADLADWAVDTAGAVVAALAYTLWPFYRGLLERPLLARTKRSKSCHTPRGGAAAIDPGPNKGLPKAGKPEARR
jgi:VanZ family protein